MRRALIGWCLLAIACKGGEKERPATQPSATQPTAASRAATAQTITDRTIVDDWLLCIECSDHELDSLLVRARPRRDAIIDTLSADLLSGPSPERVRNMQQQFRESFVDDSIYAASEGAPIDMRSPEYIDHYLGNYIAVYRARSAVALAKMGGPKAKAVLDSALSGRLRSPGDELRNDVRRAVQYARDRLWHGSFDAPPGGPAP